MIVFLFLFFGLNKGILIGDKRYLSSYKMTILNIPYHISRVNYSNLMMVFKSITNIYFEIDDNKIENLFKFFLFNNYYIKNNFTFLLFY